MVRPLSPKDVPCLALFGPLLGWGWGKGGPDSCGGQSGPSGQGPSPGTPLPKALSRLSRNEGPWVVVRGQRTQRARTDVQRA